MILCRIQFLASQTSGLWQQHCPIWGMPNESRIKLININTLWVLLSVTWIWPLFQQVTNVYPQNARHGFTCKLEQALTVPWSLSMISDCSSLCLIVSTTLWPNSSNRCFISASKPSCETLGHRSMVSGYFWRSGGVGIGAVELHIIQRVRSNSYFLDFSLCTQLQSDPTGFGIKPSILALSAHSAGQETAPTFAVGNCVQPFLEYPWR